MSIFLWIGLSIQRILGAISHTGATRNTVRKIPLFGIQIRSYCFNLSSYIFYVYHVWLRLVNFVLTKDDNPFVDNHAVVWLQIPAEIITTINISGHGGLVNKWRQLLNTPSVAVLPRLFGKQELNTLNYDTHKGVGKHLLPHRCLNIAGQSKQVLNFTDQSYQVLQLAVDLIGLSVHRQIYAMNL